ncbi:MAG: NUDIX hydrolase [Acidimicrobiales bacterium]
MSVTHVVVAAVLYRDGQVLLCHRRPELEWYPDVWDLPGGHVDDGETSAEALVRELHEELGVQISPPRWDAVFDAAIGDDTHLTVWAIDEWSGDVTNRAPEEHDRLGWFQQSELATLTLADPAILELCNGILQDR